MKEKEGIISRDAEKHLEKLNTYLNNSQQTLASLLELHLVNADPQDVVWIRTFPPVFADLVQGRLMGKEETGREMTAPWEVAIFIS